MNLKDLATHLGLSQTTVSRALNGFPEVGAKTRKRVLEAAEEFQYRPNSNAKRLATGKARTIGIIFPSERNLLIEPLFGEFLGGLGSFVMEHEYEIAITPTTSVRELDAYAAMARSGRVDGLIVSSPVVKDPRVAFLAQSNLPFILHGRTQCSHIYPWMDIDNENAFYKATHYLTDLGHSKIALVNEKPDLTFASHRYAGYNKALTDAGLRASDDLVVTGELTHDTGYAATCELLDLSEPPTAIVVSSVIMALGVMQALREKNITIGHEISLIAHDDGMPHLRTDGMYPPLTITRSSIRDAGFRIGELLVDLMNGKERSEVSELWPVDLIIRQSTGPVLKK